MTSAIVIVCDSSTDMWGTVHGMPWQCSNDMWRTVHGMAAVMCVSQHAVARTVREVMARSEAVTAVMNINVFWNMMCGLAVGQ